MRKMYDNKKGKTHDVLQYVKTPAHLHFICGSDGVCDCVNRRLYGSVDDHGGSGVEGGSSGRGLAYDALLRWNRNKSLSGGEDGGECEC